MNRQVFKRESFATALLVTTFVIVIDQLCGDDHNIEIFCKMLSQRSTLISLSIGKIAQKDEPMIDHQCLDDFHS